MLFLEAMQTVMQSNLNLSRRRCLALSVSLLATGVSAQTLPNKPIKIIVGYSAGGAVDTVARTVGQAIAASLGQPVIVENKPGAGSNIAVKATIDAPPDGLTLMMAANALAANPALYQPAPFDPERDLTPVSLIGRVPVVIAANAGAPYANIKQLIEAAKAKPGAIAFASPGNGSTPHMAVEFFERAAGIKLQHVPYRGGAQALTDVIQAKLGIDASSAANSPFGGKRPASCCVSSRIGGILTSSPTSSLRSALARPPLIRTCPLRTSL